MCLAEGSLMVYPNLRPGVLNLGRLVGAPKGGLKFFWGLNLTYGLKFGGPVEELPEMSHKHTKQNTTKHAGLTRTKMQLR